MFTVSTIRYGQTEIRAAQDLETGKWHLYNFNWDTGQVTGDRSENSDLERVAKLTDSGVRWVSKARTGQGMVTHLRKRAEADPVWADMADHVEESIENDKDA